MLNEQHLIELPYVTYTQLHLDYEIKAILTLMHKILCRNVLSKYNTGDIMRIGKIFKTETTRGKLHQQLRKPLKETLGMN